jgi:uncharacterized protein YcnI
VLVQPSASRPADSQLYTMTVPNERDVPTVEVALKIPAGVESVIVEDAPGWDVQVVRANDRIDVIRFTGSIRPDFFATFRFIARNPVEEGELVWAATQRYAGGEVVSWTGEPDSDTPAARTEISESAPATDVLDTTSGSTGSGTEPGTGTTETTATETTESPEEEAAAAADDDEGGDTLPIVLSIAALLVALAALALTLRRRQSGS